MHDKVPVALVGFGSQGRRIVEAVSLQEDMCVIGVALSQPDLSARLASLTGYSVYSVDFGSESALKKAGILCEGTIEKLVSKTKVVIDCTPAGVGKRNKESIYQKFNAKAIFQAGEEPDIADVPAFLSLIDYEETRKARFVRVASPTAVSLTRVLLPLQSTFGIKRAVCTLVKAGAEPLKGHQGPVDTLVPEPTASLERLTWETNHILCRREKGVRIMFSSVRAPSILLDVQSAFIELARKTTAEDVTKLMAKTPRVSVFSSEGGIPSTDALFEFARRVRHSSGDIYETCVWKEQIEVQGKMLKLTMAVDPHSAHIPEVIDAVRAMTTRVSRDESERLTNKALCIIQTPF